MEQTSAGIEQTDDEHTIRLNQANKLFQTAVLLIYGKRKSVDKAIKCIQRAITFHDANYKYWQLLGEAYYQRGSLNPAINCFIKSLALADNVDTSDESERKRLLADCVYSRLRMSDIRLSVGHLDEAALGYSEIITSDPNNVAALVGMSKVELQQARNSFSAGLVKSGHSHCMKALNYSLRAIKLSPNLCLTWKLASDCCIIQFLYGQRGIYSTKIDIQFPGSDEEGLSLNRLTCIELAQQLLCKAIAIEPFQNSGCLWHNLGLTLYLKSTIINESKERELLLKRSLKCLFRALDHGRKNSQVKNSIGVVAFNLNYLNSAQNFFVESIQTNLSTSELQFSNLGYIYLQKGEFRLASVAFARCQAEEPLYCRSWLGNALVNEQNNLDNLSFLRHCHKLENNYESQIMYATKVTSLPHDEEHKKDLISALDCMKRILNYDEESLEVNNTLGLLFERCNYLEQSRSCFEKAYKIGPKDSRVVFNRLRQHSASNACFTVEQDFDSDFIKNAEKLANGGNREYMLNYIFYLFSNGDYKSINPRITRLIDKLPQNDVKNKIGAQILLALAAKQNNDDFKSWLFKNIIDSDGVGCIESLVNLLCLMLFGATTKDGELVQQVMGDLANSLVSYISSQTSQFTSLYCSLEGFWLRLALVSSIFCLKDQSKLIRPLVALFPFVPELWLLLGLSLMFQKTSEHRNARFCIEKAILIGSTNPDLCFVCDILLAVQQSKQQSNNKSTSSSVEDRKKCLSRAIYKHPNYGLLWTSIWHTTKLDPKEKQKRQDQPINEQNFSLFQLAIDHTIKMIVP